MPISREVTVDDHLISLHIRGDGEHLELAKISCNEFLVRNEGEDRFVILTLSQLLELSEAVGIITKELD